MVNQLISYCARTVSAEIVALGTDTNVVFCDPTTGTTVLNLQGWFTPYRHRRCRPVAHLELTAHPRSIGRIRPGLEFASAAEGCFAEITE